MKLSSTATNSSLTDGLQNKGLYARDGRLVYRLQQVSQTDQRQGHAKNNNERLRFLVYLINEYNTFFSFFDYSREKLVESDAL